MKKIITVIYLLGAFLLTACSASKLENIRVKELDYTVVKEEDIPEELKIEIDSRKDQPFELSYESEGYLYAVRGYGQKKTGGYSIRVSDLYLGKNAVYIQLDLEGPRTVEQEMEGTSCPVIVLKLEGRTEPVIFQ